VRQEMFAIALRRLGMSCHPAPKKKVLILRHVRKLHDHPNYVSADSQPELELSSFEFCSIELQVFEVQWHSLKPCLERPTRPGKNSHTKVEYHR